MFRTQCKISTGAGRTITIISVFYRRNPRPVLKALYFYKWKQALLMQKVLQKVLLTVASKVPQQQTSTIIIYCWMTAGCVPHHPHSTACCSLQQPETNDFLAFSQFSWHFLYTFFFCRYFNILNVKRLLISGWCFFSKFFFVKFCNANCFLISPWNYIFYRAFP